MAKVLSFLDSKKNIPMTKPQTEMFMKCFFLEKDRPDDVFDEKTSSEFGPTGKILYHRLCLNDHFIPIMPSVAIFCLSMAEGNPGKVVMWAYTLNRMYNIKKSKISIDDIADKFPWGFPDGNEVTRLWDAQKCHKHNVPGDNMVDQLETWKLD